MTESLNWFIYNWDFTATTRLGGRTQLLRMTDNGATDNSNNWQEMHLWMNAVPLQAPSQDPDGVQWQVPRQSSISGPSPREGSVMVSKAELHHRTRPQMGLNYGSHGRAPSHDPRQSPIKGPESINHEWGQNHYTGWVMPIAGWILLPSVTNPKGQNINLGRQRSDNHLYWGCKTELADMHIVSEWFSVCVSEQWFRVWKQARGLWSVWEGFLQ